MSRKDEVILDTAHEPRVDHGLRPCNTNSFCFAPELPVSFDPLISEEFTSNTGKDFQVENNMFGIEVFIYIIY